MKERMNEQMNVSYITSPIVFDVSVLSGEGKTHNIQNMHIVCCPFATEVPSFNWKKIGKLLMCMHFCHSS